MTNIKIEALDGNFFGEFSKCTLITEKYTTKISKNEIHVPIAAKILVEFNGNIKAFLLKNPIIASDNYGNIDVITAMKWTEATYNEDASLRFNEIKKLKKTISLLEEKKELGLSFDEIFMLNDLKSELSMINLRKNILDLNKGGGF